MIQEQVKGNAPRVTPKDIEDQIAFEGYFTAAEGVWGAIENETFSGSAMAGVWDKAIASLGLLTICVLVLKNGYTVHGVSACASPENFNEETGRKIARENAIDAIWPLLGYELKTKLYERSQVDSEPVTSTGSSQSNVQGIQECSCLFCEAERQGLLQDEAQKQILGFDEGIELPSPIILMAENLDAMSFAGALSFLEQGKRVAREGWNGKGMYLYLVPENAYAPTTSAGAEIAAKRRDGLVPYGAYVAMKTAQDNVVPWLASQTDVLAKDWVVLD